jgi:hypothetical protein
LFIRARRENVSGGSEEVSKLKATVVIAASGREGDKIKEKLVAKRKWDIQVHETTPA